MAVSQKHQGKILVPWFNGEEWRNIYALIYSETSNTFDKSRALNALYRWKRRMPELFAEVEGTLIILEALLHDEKRFTPDELCLLKATAIMRFLNICAANDDRQGTFYKTARKKNLPDWLIDLRHDLAHSQKLPPKFMLDLGLKYCLEWLKREYWDLQNNILKDYIVSRSNLDIDWKELMNLFCIVCLESALDDKITKHIKKKLIQYRVNMSNTVTLNELQVQLLTIISQNVSHKEEIIDFIIDSNKMFCVPRNFTCKDQNLLPNKFVKAWEVFLQYVQEQKLLILLLKKLLHISENETNNTTIRELSSLWLYEIFRGLLKEKMYTLNSNDVELDRSTIVSAIEKENSQFSNSLNFFRGDKNLYNEITNLKDIAISKPSKHGLNFIRSLLEVCDCAESFISDIETAYKSVSFLNLQESDNILYSIADVQELINHVEENDVSVIDDHCLVGLDKSKWRKIHDTLMFEGCPLGILPHQDRYNNPLFKCF